MLSTRWWTLVVWALAAAGALFWGLKLFVQAPGAPPHTQLADAAGFARGDLTRLLGADAVAPPRALPAEPLPDARFQLIGVLSPRALEARGEGVALIAVDGKPPRAYRVGAVIDGQNVLQAVNARGATLGPRGGAALVALNLAPPPPPATGVPTAIGTGAPPAVMPGLPAGARFEQPMASPQPPQPAQLPQQPALQPQPLPAPALQRRSSAAAAAAQADPMSPNVGMQAQSADLTAQSR